MRVLARTALVCLLMAQLSWAQETEQPAQNSAGPQQVQAKVKEVQQKGRSRTLVVELENGEEASFPITPQTVVRVAIEGSRDTIEKGQFVNAMAILSNESLFPENVQVYSIPKGTRAPQGGVNQIAAGADGRTNRYRVAGVLTDRSPSADYPDYDQYQLQIRGRVPPILVKNDVSIQFFSLDTEEVKAGQAVNLKFAPGRGNRPTLVRATVFAEGVDPREDDPVLDN